MELEEAKKNIKIFTESPINCDNCRYCSGKRVTKKSIVVILKELTVKNNKIDKAIKYIKEKQKIQYKYALSKIEIDELLKILEG